MSTSPSEPPSVAADYFDGKNARAHRVVLSLADGVLAVRGDGVARDDRVASLRVSEPMGAAPRLITFPDGAHCEVRDHAGLARLLATGGHVDGLVVRLQDRWRWAVGATALALFTLAAGYLWGLPALSEWIARQLPESVVARLGSDAMELLDRGVFSASRLPAARQDALREAFGRLAGADAPTPRPSYRIVFRDGGRAGANALALPDGTIVVTDQLVKLAGDDEEVLAVIAHELGHVHQRHGLRMMIQGSIVGFVVSWTLGDVSSVAAGLPSLLLEARYSRDHEREADDYAARLLVANGRSPAQLARLLERLEASHGDAERQDGKPVSDYLSSHPATRERIEALTGARPR